ncbi:ATP-dependent Clp protease proteolytic subunit, partial [Nocardia asiatica]
SLHDRWFTAAQAKEYGFIDHIVDSFGQIVPQRQRIGISA